MSAASTAPFPCASLASAVPSGCTRTMRTRPRPVSLLRFSGAAAVAVGCRATRASSRRGSRRCAGQL
eukprot:4324684-Alexandrium_andersonii.AAC.1